MVNFSNCFIVLLFLLWFILDVTLRECFVEIPIKIWVKYPHIKECLSAFHSGFPLLYINFASMLVFAVFLVKGSAIAGRRCGSISTSFHNSFSKFSFMLRRSLCLIVMNPPFLQLIAFWMSILDLELHFDGVFVNPQP